MTLLQEVKRLILEEPRRFNMTEQCGTRSCLVGWVWNTFHQPRTTPPLPSISFCIIPCTDPAMLKAGINYELTGPDYSRDRRVAYNYGYFQTREQAEAVQAALDPDDYCE